MSVHWNPNDVQPSPNWKKICDAVDKVVSYKLQLDYLTTDIEDWHRSTVLNGRGMLLLKSNALRRILSLLGQLKRHERPVNLPDYGHSYEIQHLIYDPQHIVGGCLTAVAKVLSEVKAAIENDVTDDGSYARLAQAREWLQEKATVVEKQHEQYFADHKAMTGATVRPKRGNDDRDVWIYGEWNKGTPWKEIRDGIKNHSGWSNISTLPGIKEAAKRYATRQSLPSPLPR